MFYEASQIESLIICKICDQKLEDPRLLPCGRSICNPCIEILLDTDKRRIKCHYCAKIHEVPEDGFVPNLEMANLLEIKPSKAFRGRLASKLKEISNSIQAKVEKIQTDLLTGEAKVRDECDKVRNDVQLAVEEAHLMLDKILERLMNKIDDYEQDCRQNYYKFQKNKDKIEKSLNEATTFNIKIERLLKQLQLEDSVIRDNLIEAQDILNNLEKTEDKLQLVMFNELFLKFDKNKMGINDSMIGFVKKQQIKLYFVENFSNMKELDLTRKLNDSESRPFISVYPFVGSSFLFVRNFYNETIYFSIVNDEGNVLSEKVISLRNNIVRVRTTPLVNNNFFYFATLGIRWRLESFNKNLNLISKKYFEFDICFISAGNESVFLGFSKEESFLYLESYNSNLEPLMVFGQGCRDLPYFFPRTVWKMLISKKYFVLREPYALNGSKITLIRQKNGKVKSSFLVTFQLNDNWTIYLEEFVLLFSDDNMTIFSYNFNGVLIGEFKCNKDLSNFKFSLNKELYYLNFKRTNSVKLLKF